MKAKVFVQGKAYNEITAQTFRNAGKYTIVDSIEESNIVVWTGGEDINPLLYDESPIRGTYFTLERDKADVEAVKKATELGKFMVGICRGAQLLNVVPNGGTLWQDVDGHENGVHRAFDCVSGKWILVNSVHHQMMRPTDKAEILCWATEASMKRSQNDKWYRLNRPSNGSVVLEKDKDIEALWYPDTNCLLVQFHPEFESRPTTEYFFGLMDKFYFGKFDDKTKVA